MGGAGESPGKCSCTGTTDRTGCFILGGLICILNLPPRWALKWGGWQKARFGGPPVFCQFEQIWTWSLVLRSPAPLCKKSDQQPGGGVPPPPWLFPRSLTVSLSNYTSTHVNTEFLIQSQAELQIMKALVF